MAGWVMSVMEEGGHLTVALLMLLENLFPPIPSELVMPLAGFMAQRGDLNIVLVVVSGSVGSVAGAVFWYLVGRWIGCERLKRAARRYGRWITLSPKEIDRADAWFDRHGGKAVFVGRLVPAVRTLISVPAGISDMPVRRFLVYTSAGTTLWTGLLAVAGWLLGDQYGQASSWLGPASNVILGILVLVYLYRVATFEAGGQRS